MNRPRVGLDVSFCAMLRAQGEYGATGVGRVIEALVARLARNPEIDFRLVGCRGGDPRPALSSAQARAYGQERWPDIRFLESVAGRFYPWYREPLRKLNQMPHPGRLSRWLRRGVNALARWETTPHLKEADIFHSTFFALPPRHVTGNHIVRIATVHDLIPLGDVGDTVAKRVTQALVESIDPARDWVMTISEHTRNAVCSATGLAPERTAVIPLAAEAVFQPHHDPHAIASLFSGLGRPASPFFLSVANPQPRKNLPFLIRVFGDLALRAGFEDFHLLLAGGAGQGGGTEEIVQEIASLPEGVGSRVLRLGSMDDRVLSLLYSHCVAFVFPSLDEGFGLPPLEAMQCGAPVICSNRSSLPEVVGEAALLASPDDARAFLEAMSATALDQSLHARLSEASRRRAARFFWDRSAQEVMACYQRAWRSRHS